MVARIHAFGRMAALVFLAALGARAADFGPRFDEIARQATPAQLYAFLYDMPKGGDLHNHAAGANRPEWIYAVCTDPARCGGETFYTRAHFTDAPDAVDPGARFRTIRRKAYELLTEQGPRNTCRSPRCPPGSARRGATACASTGPATGGSSSSPTLASSGPA